MISSLNTQHVALLIQKQLFAYVLQQRCSEQFCNINGKTPADGNIIIHNNFILHFHDLCCYLFLIKLQAWKTSTQVFSYEYCEILQSTFLTEDLLTTANLDLLMSCFLQGIVQ